VSEPKFGFEKRPITLPIEKILPVRQLKDSQKQAGRYGTILASVREVGLVEPMMVYPQKGRAGYYLLMDGHLRYTALKELGIGEAQCLVSTEDESFTYNARISRLSPIQEHRMIVKAVENGVPIQRIAAALNMEIHDIRARMNLLKDIHEEAVELLKDKQICPGSLRILRKVKPVRQIEMAELMVNANDFAKGYAEALFMGTPKELLASPEKPKIKTGISPEDVARMEQEMETLEKEFKAIEESYSENNLDLTVIKGYVKKLLDNGKVVRFLGAKHQDIFTELERMAALEAI